MHTRRFIGIILINISRMIEKIVMKKARKIYGACINLLPLCLNLISNTN